MPGCVAVDATRRVPIECSLSRDGELMDEVVDVRSRDLESLRDRGDIPVVSFELAAQQLALIQSRCLVKCMAVLRSARLIRQMTDLDLWCTFGVCTDQCTLDHRAQLADVARPITMLERRAELSRGPNPREPVIRRDPLEQIVD